MSQNTASIYRRLPVYLLLDCSGSMHGEAIQAVEQGFRTFLGELKHDPQALDTVWLSVITFASTAQQVVPLTEIAECEPVPLEPGGSTALGAAIDIVNECIRREVRKTSREQKGDWKPMVFILTDGEPTDIWQESIDRFRGEVSAMVIACGAGPEVNDETLKRLGDKVIRLRDTQPGTFRSFMQWVSTAVTTASQVAGTSATDTAKLGGEPQTQTITFVK
jgi:uncharacterized protein YegL